MKAENFIKEILVGDLQASYVAVGEDFRFGFERKGTPQMLKEYRQRNMGLMWKSCQKKWMDAGRSAALLSGKN